MASSVLAATVLLAGACSSDDTGSPSNEEVPRAVPSAPLITPTNLGGTLFYYPDAAADEAAVMSWAPEGDAQPSAMIKLAGGDALSNATFSPDGKRVAWVASDYDNGATELHVANVDGSGGRMLMADADPYCVEPTWSGDSARLLARPASEAGVRSIDVATGAASTLADTIEGCHALWSADGTTIAFSVGQSIAITNADGSGRRAVPRLGTDGGQTRRRSHDPMSLSADGRLLALWVTTGDTPDGDVARALVVNEIIDTVTGETKALPIPGELRQAYFLPKGGVVLRVKGAAGMEIALLGPDLKLVTKVSEPAALGTMVLLGYGG